jgi:hypothetical protein
MLLGLSSDLQLKQLILIVLAIFVVCLIVVNGILLAFWPDSFLRFYDWQNPGDHVGKTAPWRKNVHNFEWRCFGVLTAVSGLFFLSLLIKLLWRG